MKVSDPKSTGPKSKRRRRTIGFMPLEPRIMYDGAGAASAVHHHHSDHPESGPAASIGGAPMAPPAPPAPAATAGNWHVNGSASENWVQDATRSISQAQQNGAGANGNTQWQSHGTPNEPMPQVSTWVKDPTEIVFIDSAVPDYQILAAGAKPGVEVVILDANSDGVDQIANFLNAHPDPNLTTIDIVAHGADGVVQLGTTLLSSSTIADYQTQLAAIGNAMQPGGNIEIYGCDVAQDFNGDLFLVQLSQATGGKNVVASSGLVGAAALGAAAGR